MTQTKRLLQWTLSAALSLAALGLSTRPGSADWHFNSTSSPAVASGPQQEGNGNCIYSLPAQVSGTRYARVGVNFGHSWLWLSSDWQPEYQQYGQGLGYTPEAMIYHQCRSNAGATAWFGSNYYQLWSTYRNGRSNDTDSFYCPPSYPRINGAYCFTRAWW